MDWDHFEQIPKSARREPIRTRTRFTVFADYFAGAFAFLILALAVAAAVIIFFNKPAYPREQYPGQYAQVDPSIRQWFRDQKIPGTQSPCCSEADGVYAEEDIRGKHYWTRFVAKFNDGVVAYDVASEWMQVPDEVVIHNPNRHGAPVVWWGWTNEVGLIIRCFAPGGGV